MANTLIRSAVRYKGVLVVFPQEVQIFLTALSQSLGIIYPATIIEVHFFIAVEDDYARLSFKLAAKG